MKARIQPVKGGEKGEFTFYCPGCGCHHSIWSDPSREGASWAFNGDMLKPTFKPSVKVTWVDSRIDEGTNEVTYRKEILCHFYVDNGFIRYLSDCTHDYRGKTYQMQVLDIDDAVTDTK